MLFLAALEQRHRDQLEPFDQRDDIPESCLGGGTFLEHGSETVGQDFQSRRNQRVEDGALAELVVPLAREPTCMNISDSLLRFLCD